MTKPTKPLSKYVETIVDPAVVSAIIRLTQANTESLGHGFTTLAVAIKQLYDGHYAEPNKSDEHLISEFTLAIHSMRPEGERTQ